MLGFVEEISIVEPKRKREAVTVTTSKEDPTVLACRRHLRRVSALLGPNCGGFPKLEICMLDMPFIPAEDLIKALQILESEDSK